MSGGPHQFPVRIYYEDTDHGGVVYYANYLKFMERARTEFLRDLGLELDELESTFGILFAVTEVHVHYLNPARFNDAIIVESMLLETHGARLVFRQNICRKNKILVEGDIRLACMDRAGHPRRIPDEVVRLIQPKLAGNVTMKACT
ncbi:MAG: tol-pal system-associated acyl-CoA thioesterase [Mariprofundaceae bacterium]|nr:tol-pal system-associated acyl-CoA thioesterase [Mariprofundaceae bacterium]